MSIRREIEQMMIEMESRTNGMPAQIVCSQDTLNELCEQVRAEHISEADIEEGSKGYVGRYMGVPIIVSSEVEPGKAYLVPRPDAGTNWWTHNPFSYLNSGWQIAAQTFSPHYDPYHPVNANNQDIYRQTKQAEEPVDIDEDSFLDILKGSNNNPNTEVT